MHTNLSIGSFTVEPQTLTILDHWARQGSRCIQGKVPSILHVNRESREVGKKEYKLVKLGEGRARSIFTNWELDIFLDPNIYLTSAKSLHDKELAAILMKMQSLSVLSTIDKPVYAAWIVTGTIEDMMIHKTMRSLRSLTVLSSVLTKEERQDLQRVTLRSMTKIKLDRISLEESDGRETDLMKKY